MMQGDNWNDLLKEVVTFDTVEEFWGVYVRLSFYAMIARGANTVTRTT